MSFLGWIDYDESLEAAARNAVASLRGRDAREELGLGGLRDTLADLFFPGTSTIQRRLRYFLFVSWCCEAAVRDRGRRSVLASLRSKEEKLIQLLMPLGEGEGVIGLQRGSDLVTMPSAIYWSGLKVLDMRSTNGSIGKWARLAEEEQRRDDAPREDVARKARSVGFSEDLPPIPSGFLEAEGLTFQLEPLEREYLHRRLANAVVAADGWGLEHNLFAHFSGGPVEKDVRFPWQHPNVANLSGETRQLLRFAEGLSAVMYGATLLYNYLICVLRQRDNAADADHHLARYAKLLSQWERSITPAQCRLIDADILEVAKIAPRLRHGLEASTISFVQRWAQIAKTPKKIIENKDAQNLVKAREEGLKLRLGTSRFANKAARARWRYESGGRLDFRWAIARTYLNDIAQRPNARA